MKTLPVTVGVVVALLNSSLLLADSPAHLGAKRLIETGKQTREIKWMTENEITEISRREHLAGRCGGFMDVTEHQARPEGLRVRPTFASVAQVPSPTQQRIVEPLLGQVSARLLGEHITGLSNFHTRHARTDTGIEAVKWLQARFLSYAQGRTDVSSELVGHSFKQPSLIVRIQGSGPRANERVIMGAHVDSINHQGFGGSSNRAPGADDDASGVATVLETFRILMDSGYKPDRTLEFMAYAGEELGLLGSQDIAESYRKKSIAVAGVLHMDMTMFPGPGRTIHFITDHTDASLTQFGRVLLDSYVKTPWKNDKCGYACSDHASWTKSGYPTVYPFEADEVNPALHTTGDLLNRLDTEYGTQFVKLGLAFAVEMSAAPVAN